MERRPQIETGPSTAKLDVNTDMTVVTRYAWEMYVLFPTCAVGEYPRQ